MTPPNEDRQYDRPVARIRRFIVAFGVAGAVFAFFRFGPRDAAGFLLGSLASFFSFWRQKKVAESLGPENVAKRPPVMRFIVQFAALALTGYVIVKYLEVKAIAIVLGLLVTAAAALAEILYELIFIR